MISQRYKWVCISLFSGAAFLKTFFRIARVLSLTFCNLICEVLTNPCMRIIVCLPIILGFFVGGSVFAQRNVSLQQISVRDGLSQNTINCIFQDSRGFMWFGTQNGLNKYDGSSFSIFKHNVGDSTSISSDDVYCAFEDNKKDLWFGTSAGLSKFNRHTNTFSNFDFDHNSKYSMRPVWSIIGSARDKKLWIGASGGLFSFDPGSKKITHFLINDSIQHANSALTICEDNNGLIWVGTSEGGLLQFDRGKSAFKFLDTGIKNGSTAHDAVNCILQDSDGFIWIGMENGVLSRYEVDKHSFIHLTDFQKKYPIIKLMESRDGQLWVGTDKGGAFLVDKAKLKFTPLYDKPEKGTNVVLSLLNDAKGDVWLGTYHAGAFLFDKMDTTFNHFQPYAEIKNSEESNAVLSLHEQGTDLWIGTDGGGLCQKNSKFIRYFKKSASANSIAGNTIKCIKSDNNNLYIGTYADGMSIFNLKTGKFTNYSQAGGLSDNSIYAIYPDGDFVWIGTNKGGLNPFHTKRGTFRHFVNNIKEVTSISSNTIRSIYKDSRNKLWIGTVSGLNQFNEQDSTFISFLHRAKSPMSNINVLSIHEDAKKNMWFGTHGGGLNRYDYRTDTFTSFQEKDGLGGNIVYGILEDGQGNLWLSTNKGITRFDPEKKVFKNFDLGSGLVSTQFNVGSYHKGNSGKMYFGNTEGVCSFFPYTIRTNNFLPPVLITDFLLFNKPVIPGEGSPLKQAIGETTEITLDYTQTVFNLKFSALNFSHADKNSYAYMLEPFDKEWNYVDNTNVATYTNLDPGTYIFKVKGSNNDKQWNENFASLNITITPPYWKTTWFQILASFVLISVIYVSYRVKVNSIKTQKEMLSQLVEKRTAEIEVKSKQLFETEVKNAQLVAQKLNDELASKSKELTNYTLLIVQKNRLLDELKKKLKEVIRHPGTSNLRDFKNLIQLINYNFSPEKEWVEFNTNFNRLHEGFADSLKSKYPELTNYDIRLCKLYRIGIPTKDIAEAMGISQTSVKMARYRLRKKLGLPPDEDINKFFEHV
jgi:ligand-binding sensor domain-containing protein/DNA-binding CsgD family transcriptional regulator